MVIPKFRKFPYAILEILSDGEIHTPKSINNELVKKFNFSEEDLLETTKKGSKTKVKDRIDWSLSYLNHSPLINRVSRGKYKITDEGIKVLDEVNLIDDNFLNQYEEFRKYRNSKKKDGQTSMGDSDAPDEKVEKHKYTMDDFLNDVFFDEDEYITLVNLLKNKQNIIIEGAPGVGKTFLSKRLAYSIMGVKDKQRVEFVQFHQSYSYEDFIMGYRPSKEGFKLEEGVFYDFCKKAEEDEDNQYFFIIDEINRGNLSKIFGELFMLIEGDKRGYPVKLLYNKESFSIPNNVYIIGLMNTADRSLAMLDYALRRRFSFFELTPAFDTYDFKKYMAELDNFKFNKLIGLIKDLNDEISKDEVLGEGFQIGHSYFSNLDPDELDVYLENIINYDIIPLLKEYWFDEKDKVDTWSNRLRNVIL